ncbi:hypothetical protein EVAR_4364_1 [Eumeta japonica]|uniref:Uncharacterized protein n=1 Tax=Eumeta variegata TaxID=151549 RepID=A0A4C1T0X6_EUMVA|nr:hypothetical protein EVAR_4364_1 [Eumeta japonica]
MQSHASQRARMLECASLKMPLCDVDANPSSRPSSRFQDEERQRIWYRIEIDINLFYIYAGDAIGESQF